MLLTTLTDKAVVFVEGINVTDEDVHLYSRYEEMTFLFKIMALYIK